MKTKEELNALKEEVETMSRKLAELTDEELEQVTGGIVPDTQDGKFFVLVALESDSNTPAYNNALGGVTGYA